MKKIMIVAIGLIIVTFLSTCYKSSPMPYNSWGFFQANLNRKKWHDTYKNAWQQTRAGWGTSGTAVPCSSPFVYMVSSLYSPEGHLRQEFMFTKVPLSVGRYSLVPFRLGDCQDSDPTYAHLYTSTSDGDVMGDTYNTLTTEDNYIQINEYNPETQEITGEFKVTMVARAINYGHFLPDTLRFTEGKFHTKILAK